VRRSGSAERHNGAGQRAGVTAVHPETTLPQCRIQRAMFRSATHAFCIRVHVTDVRRDEGRHRHARDNATVHVFVARHPDTPAVTPKLRHKPAACASDVEAGAPPEAQRRTSGSTRHIQVACSPRPATNAEAETTAAIRARSSGGGENRQPRRCCLPPATYQQFDAACRQRLQRTPDRFSPGAYVITSRDAAPSALPGPPVDAQRMPRK